MMSGHIEDSIETQARIRRLLTMVGEEISVITNFASNFEGRLAGFDNHMNLILTGTREIRRRYSPKPLPPSRPQEGEEENIEAIPPELPLEAYEDRKVGVVTIRGSWISSVVSSKKSGEEPAVRVTMPPPSRPLRRQ